LGKGRAPSISSLLATHAWALPSFSITLATFALLYGAGSAAMVAQAIAIAPAMVWNYFIGDRLFGLIRGEPIQVEADAHFKGEARDASR
jgi:glycerol-3-phosphate acyltransferase PlsY